jgi:hypothetical protein
MGFWALLIASALYAIVSIDLAIKNKYALSIIFLCYTIANLGYVWLAYYDKDGSS